MSKISKKIEVEVMVKVKDESSLIEKLYKLGAVKKATNSYTDEYFDFPGWKLRKLGKRIRIRRWEDGNECEISFKGRRLSQSSDTKPDVSLKVNEEQANFLSFILEEIGLKKMVTVHQTRTEFISDNFIFELDRIKGVGTYLTVSQEIEDPNMIKDAEERAWDSVLLPLGFTKKDIELRGKIGLVLHEKRHRNI